MTMCIFMNEAVAILPGGPGYIIYKDELKNEPIGEFDTDGRLTMMVEVPDCTPKKYTYYYTYTTSSDKAENSCYWLIGRLFGLYPLPNGQSTSPDFWEDKTGCPAHPAFTAKFNVWNSMTSSYDLFPYVSYSSPSRLLKDLVHPDNAVCLIDGCDNDAESELNNPELGAGGGSRGARGYDGDDGPIRPI
jgi:hypothetical protein